MRTTPTIAAICNRVYRSYVLVTVAFVSALLISTLLLNYRATYGAEQGRLDMIAPLAANALAGEVFIGDSRAIRALLPELARKFRLSHIDLSDNFSSCSPKASFPLTASACATARIKDPDPERYVVIRSAIPNPLWNSGILPLLLACLLPALFGTIATRRINALLNKAIALPIRSRLWTRRNGSRTMRTPRLK